jgi:plastocyanin
MRSSLFSGTALAVGTAAILWGCGGSSSYSTSTPTTPSPTPTGSAASVTVSIVGDTGSAAFKPNPVSASAGDTLAFQNNGTTTHHIVLDDGSADFGALNPGQTSAAKAIKASGNFHCTIHSSMVGAINGAVPEPPPCNTPGYC